MHNYSRKILYNRFGLFMMLYDFVFKRKTKSIDKKRIFLCKCPARHKIAEREFYNDASGMWSGTRLICESCGKTKFVKDKKRPSFEKEERPI